MSKHPIDLKTARILVSNDDGINADGLAILEKIAHGLSDDVWVVAPEIEQSGAGHSLTLHQPLRFRPIEERRFAVSGTPTDCVLLAINHILADRKPDLVLSGVNRGGNLGEDVTYSGTIAAAMEGTMLGVPSIALSQFYGPDRQIDWSAAEENGADIVRKLVALGWPDNVTINVNFPEARTAGVKGVEVCRQGKRKLGDQLDHRQDPRGRSYFWIGAMREEDISTPGTDIHAVHQGMITVTPLDLDLTHGPTMEIFKRKMG
ncbi:MAG: 5'/3'-nucleotidase SurE [Rhodospirillales bacterium]